MLTYRLDIPRDCVALITQVLVGYGPFALDESSTTGNATFVEQNRTIMEEWDHDVAQKNLSEEPSPQTTMWMVPVVTGRRG
jgi:hypothetical protein